MAGIAAECERGAVMIKIITRKKYKYLTETLDKAQKTVLDMDSQIRELTNKIDEKKSCFAVNKGKPFCRICENGFLNDLETAYGYKEVYGCKLAITCESFKEKK